MPDTRSTFDPRLLRTVDRQVTGTQIYLVCRRFRATLHRLCRNQPISHRPKQILCSEATISIPCFCYCHSPDDCLVSPHCFSQRLFRDPSPITTSSPVLHHLPERWETSKRLAHLARSRDPSLLYRQSIQHRRRLKPRSPLCMQLSMWRSLRPSDTGYKSQANNALERGSASVAASFCSTNGCWTPSSFVCESAGGIVHDC